MRKILLLFCLLLPIQPAADEVRVPVSGDEIRLSFAPVVKKAGAAVVNIYAKRVIAQSVSPFAGDPFFSQFFSSRAVPRVQNSLGSGVILSGDGIVVSNYHVVGNATEIRVVLPDRREFDGEILLADADADLAIIRLADARDLVALEFGDSDAIEVGDLTLAIGNPFGVGQTVTSGIISGLARTGGGEGSGRYFIQTDAPINPGNSGGALVDMSGRLIGINTSILTRSGGSNGIGFAIPSNLVRQYVAQARAGHRRFVRPWSGIMAQTVEGDLAQALGQRVPEGVLVTALHAASPFRAAGIEPGDVLLAIDGLPVNAPAELEYRLAIRGLGGRVRVSYRRDGSPATAEVDLVAAPGSGAPPVLVEAETPFDGLVAGEVNPRVTAELDLPFDAEGVVVLETRGRSARSGLRPGDVLRAVNGRPIGSAAELAATLSERQRVWQIELLRGGRMVQLRFRG